MVLQFEITNIYTYNFNQNLTNLEKDIHILHILT